MKLVCIDNIKEVWIKEGWREGTYSLTEGKIYEVDFDVDDPQRSDYIIVKNDMGKESVYHISKFLTLEEFREKQLNQILE